MEKKKKKKKKHTLAQHVAQPFRRSKIDGSFSNSSEVVRPVKFIRGNISSGVGREVKIEKVGRRAIDAKSIRKKKDLEGIFY